MGFAGPVGLKVRIVADQAVRAMRNAVTGGNRKDLHLKNVNPGRDFQVDRFGDLRVITPGDPCPRCGGEIHFSRGIEVGHVFKLGTKYSKALKAVFLDEQGKEKPIVMGCYGIGVGRTVAAAIEQNHDQDGIIFPIPIAPFEVVILPLQMHEPEVGGGGGKDLQGSARAGAWTCCWMTGTSGPGSSSRMPISSGSPIRLTLGLRTRPGGTR